MDEKPDPIRTMKREVKSSYVSNDEAKKILAKEGLSIDKELSTKQARVVYDKNNQPTIIHRGTHNLKDVATDALYLMGLPDFTHRFRSAKRLTKKVEKKYQNNKVNAVGHSLGGLVAETSGAKGNIVTYNKFSLGYDKKNKKQKDYRNQYDIPSLLRSGDNKTKTIGKFLHPLKAHSIRGIHIKKSNKK